MGKLHGQQLTVNMCVSTAQVLTRMSAASLPIEVTGYPSLNLLQLAI